MIIRNHALCVLFIHCYKDICLITLAGIPAAIELAGMSLVTTELAPMITLSPICTPPHIVTLSPSQTLLPMTISPFDTSGLFIGGILELSKLRLP